MADSEQARLLKILEQHGRSFLEQFPSKSISKKRKLEAEVPLPSKKSRNPDSDLENQEWHGIENISSHNSEEESDFDQTDDEYTSKADENVVIFSDPTSKRSTTLDHVSKAQMKAFMSSKISKLASNSSASAGSKKKSTSEEEEEEDRTNAQNDALLHKLVHTKLLSGSLNPELDLTPAERRKALAGRIIELTGEAKLGKGEKVVRQAEKLKAGKRVREGLMGKQKERYEKELDEAKNLGNYHPTLKKLFEASSTGTSARKRQQGLKMGVGKFTGGSLRLGHDDINAVVGGGDFSRRGRKDASKKKR